MATGENDLKYMCKRYMNGSASQHDMEVIREAAHKGSLPDEWQDLGILLTTPLPQETISLTLHDVKLKDPLPDFIETSTQKEWNVFVAQQESSLYVSRNKSAWLRWTALAACIMLLLGLTTLLRKPQEASPTADVMTPIKKIPTATVINEAISTEKCTRQASATKSPTTNTQKHSTMTNAAVPRKVETKISTENQIANQIQETLTEMDDCMTDINNFESQLLAVINEP